MRGILLNIDQTCGDPSALDPTYLEDKGRLDPEESPQVF